MKKLKLLLFSLLVCLISISGVDAAKKTTCHYQQGHREYKVTYNINGGSTVIEKILLTTDTVTDSDVTELYKSWFQQSISEGGTCKETITQDEVTLKLVPEYSEPSQCYDYKIESDCKKSMLNIKVACVWVENKNAPNKKGYCNVVNLLYVGCGGASDIPEQVPALISFAVNLLKIATPIILIFISIITLLKALTAGKEDEIKKAQSSLIKKIIASVMVFFVISIVQFIVSKVASDRDYKGITECFNCFLNNKCEVNTYYKTVVYGQDLCTKLTSGETMSCKDMFK